MDSGVLNAEELSKAAAEARKKSKIIKPVERRENPFVGLQASSSYRRKFPAKPEADNVIVKQKRRKSKCIRLAAELHLDQLLNVQMRAAKESSGLGLLQLEAQAVQFRDQVVLT